MIYCANNNTVYERAIDVCNDLGIAEESVSRHLAGQRKTVGSYVLAKIDNINPEEIRTIRRWLLYSAFKIMLDADEEPILYQGGEKL